MLRTCLIPCHPHLKSDFIFSLVLSASLDCRQFAVLKRKKLILDADLSRLKKITLKLSVFTIALLTYEYIRSSLLLALLVIKLPMRLLFENVICYQFALPC